MGIKIKFSPSALEASIQNLADKSHRSASEKMRQAAIRIRDLARDYAPIKSGALESAIQYDKMTDGNRRNMFVVFVDLDKPAGKKADKVIGDYAWIMEQYLHPHGRGTPPGFKRPIRLGLGSISKAAGGKKVGGRFLSRAIKDGSAKLVEEMAAEVRRTLSAERIVPMSYTRDYGDNE